jgi:hypothetical protein
MVRLWLLALACVGTIAGANAHAQTPSAPVTSTTASQARPAVSSAQPAQAERSLQTASLDNLLPGATQPRQATSQAQKEEASAAEEKSSDASHQGIKIHGHWVLELKNPDGTVVDRREFDNSIVQNGAAISGPQILVALLTGDVSAAGMGVAFIQGPTTAAGSDPSAYCYFGAGTQAGISCYMLYNSSVPIYSTLGSGTNTWQAGLSQTASFGPTASNGVNGPNVNIVLSGNYIVPAGLDTVNAVSTYEAFCGYPLLGYSTVFSPMTFSRESPVACTNADPVDQPGTLTIWIAAFTNTNVPTPLSVSTGQVITVTVTISFS